jgi:hypothetical protein
MIDHNNYRGDSPDAGQRSNIGRHFNPQTFGGL